MEFALIIGLIVCVLMAGEGNRGFMITIIGISLLVGILATILITKGGG